ncbi:hypothetical protein VPHK406_0101 [Vibrio phage K406]
MILDSVCVVVEYTKVTNDNGEFYYQDRILEGHVYHGQGAAIDADNARLAAEEVDRMHGNANRYHKGVRMDYECALKQEVLDV